MNHIRYLWLSNPSVLYSSRHVLWINDHSQPGLKEFRFYCCIFKWFIYLKGIVREGESLTVHPLAHSPYGWSWAGLKTRIRSFIQISIFIDKYLQFNFMEQVLLKLLLDRFYWTNFSWHLKNIFIYSLVNVVVLRRNVGTAKKRLNNEFSWFTECSVIEFMEMMA